EVVDPQASENEAQSALMLVESRGLKSLLGFRADDEGSDMSAAMLDVRLITLIEGNDQQTATQKRGIIKQRTNIGLQPCVGLREGPVVSVIDKIRHDARILRQCSI